MWETIIYHLQINPCICCSLSFWSFFSFLVFYEKGRWKVSARCMAILGRPYLRFCAEPRKRTNRWYFWKCETKKIPCISVTFNFSLFRNPQCMIPFIFTVTSHLLIILALSFSIFIGITIIEFQRHGLHFFSFLLPTGVPLPLTPFLVLLEIISYCFRALSLGIHLFANMMAGHSLVKISSGFAWTMLFLNNMYYFIGDPGPLFIV
ncbi:hypothetical protein ZWY2020_054637 [Hordeum vulgare]|nr:hypothetical protein ZWY2020_054637 [Hordeum vulgare]